MSVTGTESDANLTLATELTATTDDTATYKQLALVNIATIDQQRGVSLKEQAAVAQSGMSYSPEQTEIMAGTTRIRSLIQRLLLTGNWSASGGTSTNEGGTYNNNGFDGLRMITGGYSSAYQGLGLAGAGQPNATIVNTDDTTGGGPFTITQAVNNCVAGVGDQGGSPSLLMMSNQNKARLMNEQEGKQRTPNSELIPGVMVQTIATENGDLPILGVPGAANALGTYLRTSDSASVGDIYVLDEDYITLRWLGSPDINVLEIPMGVDGKLSRRFILFALFGLQVADAGVFQGKVRVVQ